MNLLEQYIEEIHDVKEIEFTGRNGNKKTCIEADITTNCYGHISRNKTTFLNWDEWEKVKEQGFYLA